MTEMKDFVGQTYQVGDYVFWYKQTSNKKIPTLGQVTKFTDNGSIIIYILICEKGHQEKSTVRLVHPARGMILRDDSAQYIFKEVFKRK